MNSGRSRKRENPYHSRHGPYSFPKRRRRLPADDAPAADADGSAAGPKQSTTVVVIGVPVDCSVLDLKSRFEMYGPISRTRMDPDGVAYITFRSNDSAQSAFDAARDPNFPISLQATPVNVIWATDPVPQWKEGTERKDGLLSKLVRPEVPLSKRGKGNRLGSAVVKPRDENNDDRKTSDANNISKNDGVVGLGQSMPDGSFRGREIVAYDDIL